MFAVIEWGGKQYRVEPGDVLDVELLAGAFADAEKEIEKGSAVRFDRVLAVSGAPAAEASETSGMTLGTPLIEGALVKASFVSEGRGPKIRVFKTKKRNTQRRTHGHRQHLHRVRIDSIELPSRSPSSVK